MNRIVLEEVTIYDIRQLSRRDDDTFLGDGLRIDGEVQRNDTILILRYVLVLTRVREFASVEELEVVALANLACPEELACTLLVNNDVEDRVTTMDRTQRIIVDSRFRDITTVDLQYFAFADLVLFVGHISRPYMYD